MKRRCSAPKRDWAEMTLVIYLAVHDGCIPQKRGYNTDGDTVEKKLFWIIFVGLSLLADVFLPFFWGMVATLPIVVLSWWLVYRSGWLV